MARLRLATFNIENLFTRYDFSGFSDARDARYLPDIVQFLGDFGDGDLSKFAEFKRLVQTATIAHDDDHRQHTALAFEAVQADVYCLQEVDSIDALRRFMAAYVGKLDPRDFPNLILHEGNDMRGIDVAAVTRDIRPTYSRSHAPLTISEIDDRAATRALIDAHAAAKQKVDDGFRGRIFRRDCLELEVAVGGERVSVFNCHFKSMGGSAPNKVGMRQLEAIAVRHIIETKFDDPADALWAVCGDLNSYRGRLLADKDGSDEFQPDRTDQDSGAFGGASGVDPLLADGFGLNLVAEALAPDLRWTHYYARKRHKTQLDYIIASPALAARIDGPPLIVRNGMPYRVVNSAGIPRYPRVGWDRPKASDHCPVVVEFDI